MKPDEPDLKTIQFKTVELASNGELAGYLAYSAGVRRAETSSPQLTGLWDRQK
jgi:hypothetical protein